jgi:hypothetical protein
MTPTESIELTLHFTIWPASDESQAVVLRAIGPRKAWPPRKPPESFEEALEITPAPLPFDAVCGICTPRSRSPILCDACTVEANISNVGAARWLKTIGVPITPGDFILRGHTTWHREDRDRWSAVFVAKSLEPRPLPAAGRYSAEPLDTIIGKRALIGFALPGGGEEHLWVKVTDVSKDVGADLEGVVDDTPRHREDFKLNDAVVFVRSEIEDLL